MLRLFCKTRIIKTKETRMANTAKRPNFYLGDYVWIEPITKGEWDVPKAGKVLGETHKQLKIVDDDGQECWVSTTSVIKALHSSSVNDVEDMITLGELEEYTILRNLHVRYKKDVIYTYIGMMLVAVNPYKDLGLYTQSEMKKYSYSRQCHELPAHIYAVGCYCFYEMKQKAQGQCILISGESGAGKTESTKILLEFLAALSGRNSWIEQQVVAANPILEGFGNAKTVRNDNSSRFGKYVLISFNEDGVIEGACIQQYLLEKSRVTKQGPGNSNYHIFYSILAGLTNQEKKELYLDDVKSFKYLKAGENLSSDRNEREEFHKIRLALKVLNFSDDEVWEILKLLAAILHLGNVKYKSSVVDNMDSVEINDQSGLDRVLKLLGVPKENLMHTLSKKTILVEGQKVVSEVTKKLALVTRDGFARALYSRIFTYVVDKINKAVFKHEISTNYTIGVLDIFGFENFDNNSFEQLCINYANEHLQQFFVQHIFKLEQAEYIREGLRWEHISFVDNEKVLELIGNSSLNVFVIIDEQSKLPSGTDQALLTKTNMNHSNNKYYTKYKSELTLAFGIRHYAGTVSYNVEGFLEKNRNTLSSDWLELLRETNNNFLKSLFGKEMTKTVYSQSKTQTVISQYRQSMEALMKALVSCQPFFIRCIKPNDFKQPNMFDHNFCCRQLRYSGMMETAKIRRMGYPIRHAYSEFVYRYRVLVPGVPPAYKMTNHKAAALKICQSVLKDKDYEFGHTKIFLKAKHDLQLEQSRDKMLEKSVILLQKNTRRWLLRKRYLKMKKAAVTVQKHWRGHKPRKHFLIIRQGYLRLQSRICSRQLTHKFTKLQLCITHLQAICRGYLKRKEIKASKPVPVVEEVSEFNIEDWITSIFEAAIEDSDLPSPDTDTNPQITNLDVPRPHLSQDVSDRIPMARVKGQDEDEEEENKEVEQMTFRQFAVANFRDNVNYQFSKRPLKQSLLDIPLPSDQVAATALWITILRFMGDLPEPPYARVATSASIMSIVTETLSRNTTLSKEYSEAIKILKEESSGDRPKGRLMNLTLAHRNKLEREVKRGQLEGNALKTNYSNWLENTRSNILQKLHFIIGHGILRAELRDEIYSQICKQLSGNPSAVSQARGWALMALCVGCFAPSDKLTPHLRSFLASGPSPYNKYCRNRLQRTLQNGTRCQPPSWHELNAIRNQQSMTLAVNLMDSSIKYLEADSATTAEEMCTQLCDYIDLKDKFGFSLFITVFGEVIRLEAGSYHVMDAISQCEQDAKERGVAERDTPWQLVFRKEMFAPWQGLSAPDPVATNLIYRQIVRGIKLGEYRCSQESELAMLAAQQYYIEHGSDLIPSLLQSELTEYIPSRILKQTGNKHWENLVSETLKKSYFLKGKVPEGIVKSDIVVFSKTKWPLLFSKYYEAVQVSGPDLGTANVILAVNSEGISIVTNTETVLLQLSYVEIMSVSLENSRLHMPQFFMRTIQGYHFVFYSPSAEVFTTLVSWVLNSLKQISKYFIAVQDYSPPGGGSFLDLKKGDLVALEESEVGGEWLTGFNVNSGEWGEFPAASVIVLSTILQPPADIMEYFAKEGALDGKLRVTEIKKAEVRNSKHTLHDYAAIHFRPPQNILLKTGSETDMEELWRHSPHPIRQPLHRSLLQKAPQTDLAVTGYMAILKYMGDLPATKQTDNTEIIFQAPLENEILRDELYCQIMKQLTDNKFHYSEERGWELMWMATGLFSCSMDVLRELRLFLQSHQHPLALESLYRLEQTLMKGNRKYPPHWTEVEAVQRNVQITHNICFPNNMEETFEVTSMTRISDLIQQIGDRLALLSTDGFSLVVAIHDKTVALANGEFLFDAIQEICTWIASEMQKKINGTRFLYELMFMRKVWMTMVPGKDKMADLVCHFPQELPKYLLGFQRCSRRDAITLAAFIYRAEFGEDKSELLNNKKVLSRLVPPHMLKLQGNKEWRKAILEEYIKYTGMASDEAKIEFLKFAFSWSTFGSAFFDVKQTTAKDRFPEEITIAINKNGVIILDKKSKEPLTLYPFTELTNWASNKTSFKMKVGIVQLLCQTMLGYKMDDLISSYMVLIAPRNNGL